MRSHAKSYQCKLCMPGLKQLTFKRKIGKERHVLGAFSALRQSSEDKKSPPPSTIGAHANTLQPYSERVEIAGSDHTSSDSPHCPPPSVCQKDPRQQDARRKDPSRNVEGYRRLYLPGPSVKEQEIRTREEIDCIYCNTDEEKDI